MLSSPADQEPPERRSGSGGGRRSKGIALGVFFADLHQVVNWLVVCPGYVG